MFPNSDHLESMVLFELGERPFVPCPGAEGRSGDIGFPMAAALFERE